MDPISAIIGLVTAYSTIRSMNEANKRVSEAQRQAQQSIDKQVSLAERLYPLGSRYATLGGEALASLLTSRMLQMPPSQQRTVFLRTLSQALRQVPMAPTPETQAMLRLAALSTAQQAMEQQRAQEISQALALREQQMQVAQLLSALGGSLLGQNMGALANASNQYAQMANAVAQQINIPAQLQALPYLFQNLTNTIGGLIWKQNKQKAGTLSQGLSQVSPLMPLFPTGPYVPAPWGIPQYSPVQNVR